jgi:hypothetical protein
MHRLRDLEFYVREIMSGEDPPQLGELEAQRAPLNMFLKRHQAFIRKDEADASRRLLVALITIAKKHAETSPADREKIALTDDGVIDEELTELFRSMVDGNELLDKRLRAALGGPNRL